MNNEPIRGIPAYRPVAASGIRRRLGRRQHLLPHSAETRSSPPTGSIETRRHRSGNRVSRTGRYMRLCADRDRGHPDAASPYAGVVGVPYVVVLGAKIALSIWMFVLAWSRRRRTSVMEAFREEEAPPTTSIGKLLRAVSGYNTLIILGLIVFLLSDLLKTLYELALR